MARAEFIPFRVGEKILVRVVELLEADHLIVNFDGDLFRVTNETRTLYQVGDWIRLEVMSDRPLRFRIQVRAKDHLDRFA